MIASADRLLKFGQEVRRHRPGRRPSLDSRHRQRFEGIGSVAGLDGDGKQDIAAVHGMERESGRGHAGLGGIVGKRRRFSGVVAFVVGLPVSSGEGIDGGRWGFCGVEGKKNELARDCVIRGCADMIPKRKSMRKDSRSIADGP